MVRDYSEDISEAESSVAQTIGILRLAEEDHTRAVNEGADRGNKALAASRRAEEYRAAGNTADAEKFDNSPSAGNIRRIHRQDPGTEPGRADAGR